MQQQEQFLSWFAGFLDGEGCFSIVLAKQRTANDFLAVKPQIRVGLKNTSNETSLISYIQSNIGAGKIYYSNKNKENGVVYWQTTKLSEAIEVTKKVLPFLILKKKRAENFLRALEIWVNTRQADTGRRYHGLRLRTKEEVLELVKIATSLNSGRQTKRYRDYKGYDYWKSLINIWYSENRLTGFKGKN